MDPNIETGPCYYFCSKDDGTIIDANETICRSLGYTKKEIIGQKQDIIFPIATKIFQQTHLFPLLKMNSTADEILISLKTKSDEKISVLFNIERKNAGREALTVFIGIRIAHRKIYEEQLLKDKKAAQSALFENTALKEVKDELRKRIEELDQHINIVKRQSAELSQFNKVVTHDLQEPFRKLSLFASILSNKSALDKQIITDRMLHAAKKAGSIVSGLQQYIWVTGTALNRQPLNLNDLVLIGENKIREEWPGINITVTKSDVPVVKADMEQMKLFFYHLLSNVVRFRKPGENAYATFSAKILKFNKFKNTLDKYIYEDYARFTLKDEGMGFDGTYKEQVFELFKTFHETSGAGVGLSLCKKIIENHDGTISIDSTMGEGTTIIFTLPLN